VKKITCLLVFAALCVVGCAKVRVENCKCDACKCDACKCCDSCKGGK